MGNDMSGKDAVLTEKTWIPLGAVVIIFGAAAWLTSVHKQGEANASEIVEIKQANEKSSDKIEKKLEKIDEKVDRLLEKSKLR